eukprot:UN10312
MSDTTLLSLKRPRYNNTNNNSIIHNNQHNTTNSTSTSKSEQPVNSSTHKNDLDLYQEHGSDSNDSLFEGLMS